MTKNNTLAKAYNQDIVKIEKTQRATVSIRDQPIYKDTIVRILNGPKKGAELKVKQIFQETLYLAAPKETDLYENWV